MNKPKSVDETLSTLFLLALNESGMPEDEAHDRATVLTGMGLQQLYELLLDELIGEDEKLLDIQDPMVWANYYMYEGVYLEERNDSRKKLRKKLATVFNQSNGGNTG